MKKTQVALAALALVASSAAMADVAVYGLLDAGIASAGGKTTFYGDGNNATTLFGLRGSEDLGNGLKAGFNLESGLDIAKGAVNGPNGGGNANLFNRAANISLSTDTVGLTLGNQFSNAVLAAFVYGGTAVGGDGANVPAVVRLFGGFPGAVDQTGGTLPGTGNPANTGSSVFFIPQAAQISFNAGGFSGNVMSRITPTSAADSSYTGASVGTSVAGINVALAHQDTKFDGASTKTTLLAANTSFGDIRVNGAVASNSGIVSKSTYLVGASMPLVGALSGGLTYASGSADQGTQTTASLQYALSKSTMGYLNYSSFSKDQGGGATGNTATAVSGKSLLTVGLRTAF